ncbi:peptidylprolyl isomerase [Flavobacterium sp. Sd200]|uniref:peptidylprolyl isomerase n=1 Tax=Flavobacterium sp. Sd200 TaxID=2692211 RepID=UPI00137216E8|nr:peptidylprolyl isomerase [Flavobacterium sp. Sd200]MXN89806.1 peptidylprolyl isomerase [Flavobacterium sp. Sd200]
MRLNQVLSGLLLTALLTSGCKTAQETTQTAAAPAPQKDILFTIDDKPYYTDEFVRVYNKNLDLVKDDSQKDLTNYLELFTGYKLKVNKANKLGLQNNKKYQGELKSYRTQLAKNYLTDSKVTTELIDEAYNRSLKELRASHILIMADENAAPADTLKAYNKAIAVYKRAAAGENFEKLAVETSEDPSVKENKGDLGYFTVFRMVYPFENIAYNTPKGQVSKPVRTRFGYHIVKVTDERANRGEVTVAHIMIMKPKAENAAEAAKAKTKIDDIYKKLKQGEDFAALAKQFSEDKSSSDAGGVLNSFNSGDLTSQEFEDASFALTKPGEFSAPVETQFGWHIIKLVEKKPVKKLEEVKGDIEARIKRDERSRRIVESMNEKLKNKYAVEKDKKLYGEVVKTITDSIYTMGWTPPADLKPFDKTLLTINNDKKFTGKDFLEYVNAQQRMGISTKPVAKAADMLLDRFTSEQLNVYYNDNLEKEFPEFAQVMEEYRDGLLLFDLMEKEIWEKAKNDTIGLKNFYDANVANYQWKARVEAEVYSSTNEKDIKKTRDYLLKGKDAAYIKSKLNTKDKVNVIEKTGTYEQDSEALPKQAEWKTGISSIIKEGDYFYVTKTIKVLPAGPKTLEEAKGRVVNDYQQYLENTWVDDLKKEFTVKVNAEVFEKVKKELNQ